MVRRYDPEIDETWYDYDPSPTHKAIMEECKNGEWVPYTTYLNETARLRKQLERVKTLLKNKTAQDK